MSIISRALKEGSIDDTSSQPDRIQLSHQKNVSLRVFLAFVFCPCFLWCGNAYWPFALPNFHSMMQQLVYTAKWQVPSILLLVAAIGTTLWSRNTTARGTRSASGKTLQTRYTAHKNYLNNTFEQFLANVMALFILTTYLKPHQMHMIPLFVTLFVIGRLQYWYGYLDASRGRSNKAFGFATTFYVTCGVAMYCTYRFVCDFMWRLI